MSKRRAESELPTEIPEVERKKSNVWSYAPPVPAATPVVCCAPPVVVGGSVEFNVMAYPTQEASAKRFCAWQPQRFRYINSHWKKFDDSGMDDIKLGGFEPNVIKGGNVLFFADFFCNDAILSQLHVFITLCESFINSLTIILAYFPVATNERVTVEGHVATANTVSRMLSHLPLCGRPTRVMFYDLHTLQNRFYLHTGAISSLHSTVPLIKRRMMALEGEHKITALAFPDEGAQKRFGGMFEEFFEESRHVLCGKKRIGEKRIVVIQDGHCQGDHVLIIDDLVRTGGTLVACAKVLREAGATQVSAFVAHAAFPGDSYKQFYRGGKSAVFDRFYVTSSNPTVTNRIEADADEAFEVLDLLPLLFEDI